MQEMISIPKSEYIELKETIVKLKQDLAEMLSRLNQNSANSNFPSSTDKFNKPVSMREKSEKTSGGQKGHKGANLAQTTEPEEVETYSPQACKGCNTDLNDVSVKSTATRQEIHVEAYSYTKEHRCESKVCPCCGLKNVGAFPANIKGPVQYSQKFKAEMVYATIQQMTSYDRFRQEMNEKHGLNISDGTIFNTIKTLAETLVGFENELKGYMINASKAYFDETGINVDGNNHWMYVTSTEKASYFKVHTNRSEAALNDVGVFDDFKGLAVHDCYAMYFSNKNCKHAICYAHILRELKGLIENDPSETWAQDMMVFLKDANKKRVTFSKEKIQEKIEQFKLIVQKGIEYHESLPPLIQNIPKGKKRGREKQRKGKNLLDRFVKYEEAALLFLRDLSVPFTNNQAERDLRMIKVKLNVSIFRSKKAAENFALIRSYIETAKKLGLDVFQVLIDALNGSPFSLPIKLSKDV